MKSRIVILSLLACFSLRGATYYIDYGAADDSAAGTSTATPWKRCPGMTGFAGSYSHSAGDVFIFKGGVVWPLRLTVGYSGTTGSPDVYKTDASWYTGGTWARAIIDPDGASSGILCSGQSNVTFDGIHVRDCGLSNRGMSLVYGDGFTVTNCWIQSRAVNGLEWYVTANTATKFHVRNSLFSENPNSIYCFGATNTIASDVFIDGNTFLGHSDVDPEGSHPDGIQFGGWAPESNPPQVSGGYTFTNVVISHNIFKGDWPYGGTSQVFFGEGVGGADIHNNQFAFDNTTDLVANYMFSPGLVYVFRSSYIRIYNNTFSSDAIKATNTGARDGVNVSHSCKDVWIKNNIFSEMEFPVNASGTNLSGIQIDYNLYKVRSGGYAVWYNGSRSSNLATIQSWGFETNGIIDDPEFHTLPSSGVAGVYTVQGTSPAIGEGADLGSTYQIDAAGNLRSAPWDIGAYEYDGSEPPPPSSPGRSTAASARVGTLIVR